ncbi:MAG: peptidase S9 [Dethiosulfovibrio peptidovorans]|nr:MAG: peptidase S9 [Dethiosulfovibrio peptidovorans]
MICTTPVVPSDLLRFAFLSTPQVSPDGSSVCYALHKADQEANRYDSRLWLYNVENDRSVALTASGREKCFCWAADGKRILFASDRHDPPKGSTDLFSIRVDGGEAQFLDRVDIRVTSLIHLGEERYLLAGVNPRTAPHLEEAEYMVFENIPFCANGKGYIAQARGGLYLYRPGSIPKLISAETLDVVRYRLSPDRSKVLVVGPDFRDVRPVRPGLREINLSTGIVTELIPDGQLCCRCADYLDNRVVLSGSRLDRHGVNENVSFYGLEEGELVEFTPWLDRGLRNSIGCDCRYGTADLNLGFFVDGGSLWFVSTDRTRSRLHRLDPDGSVHQVTSRLSSVDDYHVRSGVVAVVGLEGQALQELYLLRDGREHPVTDWNGWLSRERSISTPVFLSSRADPGWDIDGWVMKPTDFREGSTYPAIVHVHGGPKTTFSDVYFHEMQLWAARGYVVAFCNPRGSDGRGNDFDDIRGRYGSVDYDDIMAFTDAVAALPFVDQHRMGITGGSYGGFMTNWVIGHTDRFKAAVAQRSISNWISKVGVSDIGYFFVADQQGADLWDEGGIETLWDHSPLKYADKVVTPTLFIHSEEDYRCELSQGLQMFTALKQHGVPTRMCVFKGENHELSRGGKPRERLARLEEISRWFDKYLKN